jgi:DNA-binding MarR family transcriptional regulator
VLVVGELAGLRRGDGWFTTKDVEELYEALRLPRPNVGATLSNLAKKDLVTKRAKPPPWSLTPVGRKTAHELLGEIDPAKLEAQLADFPGAELGAARHPVLPPSLAPPKWAAGIAELLDRFPFETNVLCMTRFPRADKPGDPIAEVIATVEKALEAHGLKLHKASDAIVEDTLWANVAAYMWACQYGFALFEDRVGEGLNYNLVIEVGSMLMAGRQTALLRDTPTVEKMPSDLVGHIYKPVDFGDLTTVRGAAHLWAADDLGLGRCKECP